MKVRTGAMELAFQAHATHLADMAAGVHLSSGSCSESPTFPSNICHSPVLAVADAPHAVVPMKRPRPSQTREDDDDMPTSSNKKKTKTQIESDIRSINDLLRQSEVAMQATYKADDVRTIAIALNSVGKAFKQVSGKCSKLVNENTDMVLADDDVAQKYTYVQRELSLQ